MKLVVKNLQKTGFLAKNEHFSSYRQKTFEKWQFELKTPWGSKRGENEFLGKKRKRHSLKFPNTKLHVNNQKNLSRGFLGKQGETDRQTDRQRERETDRQRRTRI